MSGETGVTVVTTLVCFFILHARLRAHRAPGIPCALCIQGEWFMHTRAHRRREIAELHSPSLRGAKRRSNPAFSNFAKKAGLLRFARNDGYPGCLKIELDRALPLACYASPL
jgi:hypothetical protein